MASLHRPQVGLFVVGLGTLAAPLDTAVNIAFPSITRAFDLSLEDIRWVVIAYTLTYASLMLVFGRLGDLAGYRRMFQLGLLVSAAGFGACSLAPTFGLLLLGRVLQGIGIALTLSCGPALATSLFDEHQRARALGFYAATTAAGAALGPLVGGVLIERWGWTAVFAFRVPLALVALLLSGLIPAAPLRGSVRGFDTVGAVLLVSCISSLLLALAILAAPVGRYAPLGLMLASLFGFTMLLIREMRSRQPLIQPSVFRNCDFTIMNAASVAVNFAAFGVLILVPYYLVRVAVLEVAAGGAVLALGAGGTVIGSWLAGRLAKRRRVGRLALTGIVLCVAGLGTISAWTPETARASMGLSLLAQGVGVGLFQVAYTDFVTAALPLADRGVAGSLTILTRTIGVVAGASGLSAAYAHFEAAALAAGAASEDAFLAGFQATFLYVALGLALCLALSMVRPRTWFASA
jgi:MFS family permease